MNTDKLLTVKELLKTSNRVGVHSLFTILEVKKGVIIMPFEHDNILGGNTNFLLLINNHKIHLGLC